MKAISLLFLAVVVLFVGCDQQQTPTTPTGPIKTGSHGPNMGPDGPNANVQVDKR